jgi:hypothetical protein
MAGDPVRRLRAMLLEIEALDDAAERARQTTDLLRAWPELHGLLADIRQQSVITMAEAGMGYPEIGEVIGTDRVTAWKIAKGSGRKAAEKGKGGE